MIRKEANDKAAKELFFEGVQWECHGTAEVQTGFSRICEKIRPYSSGQMKGKHCLTLSIYTLNATLFSLYAFFCVVWCGGEGCGVEHQEITNKDDHLLIF